MQLQHLHHLRHFVAVAEELHFGRAAKRLDMAQPPLSQSLQRLESLLGVALLERSPRGVLLTAPGQVLLDEGRRILAQVELAERLARRAATLGVKRLRVGFTPLTVHSVLPKAVKAFRKRWPGIDVLLEERSTQTQIDALLNGSLDVGVFIHYGAEIDGLALRPIARWNYVAAVPASWPLASRKRLRLRELADSPWVMHDPAMNPGVHATLEAACRAAGFAPNVVQRANQAYSLLSLVASGTGVALTTTARQMPPMKGVAYIPVSDLPADLYMETVLAWRTPATSPTLKAFIASLEEMAGRR
jgi:DNA-binding transcriptional LysR family regulator